MASEAAFEFCADTTGWLQFASNTAANTINKIKPIFVFIVAIKPIVTS